MKYLSTRGGMEAKSFSDILLGGLAPDGGLTLPETYPQVTQEELLTLSKLSYAELAGEILKKFVGDIPPETLEALAQKTYTAEVFCNGRNPSAAKEITPCTRLEENLYLLELSNGPTLAFKDMAMQLLGNLFEYVLNERGESINILGATSGDTGSAAEYAMRGKKGINVFMLSPKGKMSPFQRAQMFSLMDTNIFNIAIPAMFDSCQDLVKAVNKEATFKADNKIGAVNSINWGRIVAQVVYYFKGYFNVVDAVGEEIDFTVPSGNFGNVCAGHIARQMGLPIRKLVVATNENDVLNDFFSTGKYLPRNNEDVFQTSSPSMDISKASNLERFVFDLVERDAQALASLWERVEKGEGFTLPETSVTLMQEKYGFFSGKSNHQNRLASIKEVFEKYGVEIDTHTADGYFVAQESRDPKVKMVVLETALAAKFEETILEALNQKPTRPKHLENIEAQDQRFFDVSVDVEELKSFILKHL